MSGQHAFLPPSGAGAWAHCAAWPLMNAQFPQDDTEESREGTAAHWCWEQALKGGQLPAVGQVCPNGVTVTDEMLDGAEEYIATVTDALRLAGRALADLNVEQRVYMPGIHAQNWGTPDTWFHDPDRNVLFIADYKFGHDPVEAFENWQCVDYAAGIIDKLAAERAHWSFEAVANFRKNIKVRIVIVQPRNYITGRAEPWTVTGAELAEYWPRLAASAEAAMQFPPLATPGKHCKHCPGRHACEPIQRQGYTAVHFARQTIPAPLTPEAVAGELKILQDNLDLLKARISGLEADAEARLRRGETVPGYGLESSKGREAWNVPREQIVALGGVFGVTVEKPGLITPNQARAAGFPADVVAKMAGSSSRVKLARVDQSKLTRAFGK